MNKSIRVLLFGLITVLGLSGCGDEEKTVEVPMNSIDFLVHSFRDYSNTDMIPYSILQKPKNGVVQITKGTITERKGPFITTYKAFKVLYTPTIDYIGGDTIILEEYTYMYNTVTQKFDKTTKKTTINIKVVKSNLISNTKPIANDQNITIDYETETDFNITGSDDDNDTFIFVIESNTSNGTIVLIDETTGDVTYTPNQGYSGADNFTFKVVDENNASSNIADVNITVKGLCDMDPTASGCPMDPCIVSPTTTPGCPGFDICLENPTAPGCPLDPCITAPTTTPGCPGFDPCTLDPYAPGCPLDPCLTDPQSSPTCPGYYVDCLGLTTEAKCSIESASCFWLIDECVSVEPYL